MRGYPKDERKLIEAMRLANDGHHARAAAILQDAGNEERPPAEKKTLWDAAKRHRDISNSD